MNEVPIALGLWTILESWFGHHVRHGECDHIQVQLVGFQRAQMLD